MLSFSYFANAPKLFPISIMVFPLFPDFVTFFKKEKC